MCTILSHSFVALAAGKACYPGRMPGRFWWLAMGCSSLPDIDVGLMAWGVPYESFFGHRGFLHSIAFAAVVALVVVCWAFRREVRWFGRRWWSLIAFFFLLTASHGVLDMFTNGGHGIALFAPFDNTRYFMPFTPIEVSAIGFRGFIKYGGLQTLASEILWVWLPTTMLFGPIYLLRRRRSEGIKAQS